MALLLTRALVNIASVGDRMAKKTASIDTHLADALVVATHFFANCSDDVLDPDLAVQKLEEIAACLQGMNAATKEALKRYVAGKAGEASTPEAQEFLSTMCEHLGL